MEENEEKLMDLLIDIFPDKGFVVCTCVIARDNGIIDETIEYIENHPEAGSREVGHFVVYEDYDGPCKIRRDGDYESAWDDPIV